MKYRAFFFLAITITLTSLAGENDCKEILRKVYDGYRLAAKNTKRGFLLKYAATSVSSANERVTEDGQIAIRQDKMHVKTKSVEMFQDESDFVAVNLDKKVILITKPQPNVSGEQQVSTMFAYQDSLLKYLNVVSCSTVVNDHKISRRYISMIPPKDNIKKSQVSLVEYWVDDKNNLDKFSVHYNSSSKILESEMEIKEVNYDYNGPVLSSSAISQVMDARGKLTTRFSDFRLVDVRKMKDNSKKQ